MYRTTEFNNKFFYGFMILAGFGVSWLAWTFKIEDLVGYEDAKPATILLQIIIFLAYVVGNFFFLKSIEKNYRLELNPDRKTAQLRDDKVALSDIAAIYLYPSKDTPVNPKHPNTGFLTFVTRRGQTGRLSVKPTKYDEKDYDAIVRAIQLMVKVPETGEVKNVDKKYVGHSAISREEAISLVQKTA